MGFPRSKDELNDKYTAMRNTWCMVSCGMGVGHTDIEDRLRIVELLRQMRRAFGVAAFREESREGRSREPALRADDGSAVVSVNGVDNAVVVEDASSGRVEEGPPPCGDG